MIDVYGATEVQGLPQPPPVRPLGALARGKAGAALRGARAGARGAKKALNAQIKLNRGVKKNIAALVKGSKGRLRALRAQVRANKAQIRQLKKLNKGSVYNRAGRRSLRAVAGGRRGNFLLWAHRKLLRLLKTKRVGDGRNHGFTGVKRGSKGRTGLAGR